MFHEEGSSNFLTLRHDHRLFPLSAPEASWQRSRYFLLILQKVRLIGTTRNHLLVKIELLL